MFPDWTAGEDEAMAYYRGESRYDPRPAERRCRDDGGTDPGRPDAARGHLVLGGAVEVRTLAAALACLVGFGALAILWGRVIVEALR